MTAKRSRTASTVAPPAPQSWSTAATPRIGSACCVTERNAGSRPGAITSASRPGSEAGCDQERHGDDREHRAELTRGQPRARLDQKRHRRQPQALTEDAEGRVDGKRDEEAVGAAGDPEAAQIENGLHDRRPLPSRASRATSPCRRALLGALLQREAPATAPPPRDGRAVPYSLRGAVRVMRGDRGSRERLCVDRDLVEVARLRRAQLRARDIR